MISQDEKEKNVVLFVDDDPQALRIGKFLERYGFIFKVTSDPNKALEWVEENHLDLVLVDLRMSPMDGVELTEEIKKIRPGIPIVVFSAFLRDSFWKGKVKKAQDYFEDILEKPFPVAEDRIMDFCQRLQAIINKHKKDYSEPDAESFPEQLEDPFSVSFQSYLKLDHKVTRQIRRRAWELRRDWFLDGIKKERWDWVVLCGSELVKSSLQGAPLPTEDELADLGNRHERIPFLFVRP